MKRFRGIVVILSAVLLLLIIGIGFLSLQSACVFVGGSFVGKDSVVLDLSGKESVNIKKVTQLTALEQLDLRGTPITVDDYQQLRQALPNCSILWDVPFQGKTLDVNTKKLTVSSLTEEDLDALACLPLLETVDASACGDPALLQAIRERCPNAAVICRIDLGGTVIDQDTKDVVLSDISHITQALHLFPQLERIEAQGCTDYDALLALRQQYPQCRITYSVTVGDTEVRTTASQATVGSAEGLAQALPHLTELTELTLSAPVKDMEAVAQLEATYPQIAFTYSFTLLGKTVSNRDTQLDLSGIAMENTDAIDDAMPYFRCLEKVDMCDCGIPSEEMAALNQRYPDTLFVWKVTIGKITTRTDVTYFMPNDYGYILHDKDLDELKYLTELLCLDFGHMEVTRSDYLAYMTKMQYLVLGHTQVSDISGCANMPDLIFAELFLTNIKDYSPLLNCKKLQDLNVSYNKFTDYECFLEMTQLQRLWWRGNYNSEIRTALQEALPNTTMVFTHGSSTGDGWRQSPNYYAMRDLLGKPYMTY